VPVLATVPIYATPRERSADRRRYTLAVLLVLGVFAAYAFVFWLRLTKAL
jgi:hypothetical protein